MSRSLERRGRTCEPVADDEYVGFHSSTLPTQWGGRPRAKRAAGWGCSVIVQPSPRSGEVGPAQSARPGGGARSKFNHPRNGTARLVRNVFGHAYLEDVVAQRGEDLFERDLLHVPADRTFAGGVKTTLRRLLLQAVHDAELGRDDEAARRMLLCVPDHPFGRHDVRALSVDVSAGLEVHALARG